MKTAELTGALLDYWVAKAENLGDEFPIGQHPKDGANAIYVKSPDGFDYFFAPGRDRSQGGPIIERERITTTDCETRGKWTAIVKPVWGYEGPEGLEAAMRAYLASKFGDEVED